MGLDQNHWNYHMTGGINIQLYQDHHPFSPGSCMKKLRGMCRRLRRIKLRRVRQAREGRRRVSGRGRGSSWCRCLGRWRGKQGQTEGAWPIELGWNGYVTSNSCEDKLCNVGTIISHAWLGMVTIPPIKMVTGGWCMTLFYQHWLLYYQCNLDELIGPCPPLKLNHWLKIGFIKSREPWIIYPWRIHGAIFVATWIPSIYPLYVSIYTSTMDPSWVTNSVAGWVEPCFEGHITGHLPRIAAMDIGKEQGLKSCPVHAPRLLSLVIVLPGTLW